MNNCGPIGLVGSGEFLPSMEDYDATLLAGRPARAVFLPTAAAQDGPGRIRYWLDLADGHFRRLGVEPVPLPVLDRADADDPALAGLVAGAGLVYLSGGNPALLAETLRGTRVEAAIRDAWLAGAALAGCSAGACALTDVAIDSRHRTARAGLAAVPGLAVVPGLVVLPHFDRIEAWWPGVVAERRAALQPGQTLVGIDEDTALTVATARGPYLIHGRGQVWVFGPSGPPIPYRPGTAGPALVDGPL